MVKIPTTYVEVVVLVPVLRASLDLLTLRCTSMCTQTFMLGKLKKYQRNDDIFGEILLMFILDPDF